MYWKKDNDTTIFYRVWGETGSWLTLVNGHTRSSSDFNQLAKTMLGHGYRVLAIDNRGAGQTEYSGSFSIDDIAQDILGVWQQEGVESSHVLGISMGGVVVQHLANQCPNRCKSLMLVSTARQDHHFNFSEWSTELEAIVDKLKLYVSERFFAKNKLLIKAMAKNIHKSIQEGGFLESAKQQRSALVKALPIEVEPLAAQIPCLVMHGACDQVVSTDAAVDLSQRYLQSSLVLVEKTGHLLLAEALPDLAQQLVVFLKNRSK